MATGDKYVMNGVWLTCDKGVAPSRFNVTPKPVQLYDEHFANELDKIPQVNIMPFGVCSVTQKPCLPVPVLWERVMDTGLTVLGARPLLNTSKCQCSVGGKISINFTRIDANAAVALDQKLDKVDDAADKAQEASGWAFWGGLAMGIGGAILVATGVGAPLGAAMITGAGYLMTASTIASTAAVAVKGATKFARDPSKEVGLSIVGEVALEAAKNYIMQKLGGKLIQRLAKSKLGSRIANSSFARKMEERFANALRRNRTGNPTCVGEPVDVATGKVINEGVDFELAGPLPLVWGRVWYSTSAHEGALGHGWHHAYDEELYVDTAEELIIMRLSDGRYAGAELMAVDESVFIREEKITLARTARGYELHDAAGLSHYFAYVAATESYKLVRLAREAEQAAIVFDYSPAGFLERITDSAGRELTVACDSRGRVLSIQAPHPTEVRGQVELVRYDYNSKGHLTKVTDALDQAWQFRYQGSLLVQATYKNGLSFYYEYDGTDAAARCVHTWGDENLYACTLRYDDEAYQTTVIDSVGARRDYTYDPDLGVVTRLLDARGGVTLSEYNDHGELLSETDPLGQATRYSYDERGNCTGTARPDGAATQRAYDAQGRLVALTDPLGGQWQWAYSETGLLVERADPTGQATAYAYERGQLCTITDARTQRTTTLTHDAAGNLLEVRTADGQQSRWLYDGWGRVRKSADARGNVQWREHDLLGRVTTVHEPDGNVRRFAYDALDNVSRAQDRHHDVQYAYRGLGRLVRRVEAGTAVEFLHDTEERLRAVVNEHGLAYRFELDGEGEVITEAGFDGLTRRYARDAGGRVVELALPTGQVTRYAYDPAGRVTDVRYGDGSQESYAYRLDGALLTAANSTTTVAFARDGRGNIIQERQGPHTLTSAYDAAGNRTSLTSSLGADVRYGRDAAGEVVQMQAGQWQALFERDAQGLEVQRTLSGGVRTRSQRDQLGRVSEQRISVGLGGRQSERTRAYGWQAGDRLTQVQDSTHGLTRYEHDAVGNLAATTFGDGSRQLRSPDAVGNLFATAGQQDRRYGPAGQLLEAAGTRYEYDALGNLAGKTTARGQQWAYAWNAAGHLAEVVRPDGGVVRFAYDALGRRVSKSYKGQVTRWVWDGNVPLHEWTALEVGVDNVDELVTWLFEEDSFVPAAKLTVGGSYSIVTDHLGVPSQMHDEVGELLWAAQIDGFGAVRFGRGKPQDCPFRYQGQYEDVETGLYYNRFRYYEPDSGQYISQDPLRLEGGNPNAYAYVSDCNVEIDPLGLKECKIWRKAKKDYWKSKHSGEVAAPSGKYSPANMARMKKGRSPQIRAEVSDAVGNRRTVDVPVELHHTSLPQRSGSKRAHEAWNLTESTPWGHSGMDPHRQLGKDFNLERIINGTNSW